MFLDVPSNSLILWTKSYLAHYKKHSPLTCSHSFMWPWPCLYLPSTHSSLTHNEYSWSVSEENRHIHGLISRDYKWKRKIGEVWSYVLIIWYAHKLLSKQVSMKYIEHICPYKNHIALFPLRMTYFLVMLEGKSCSLKQEVKLHIL